MYAGLGYLGAVLPISLSIDSGYQVVGQQPTYRIANASPGAQIYWSSYKDGRDTGEVRAAYGDTVGNNGSLEIKGGAWTDANVGVWQKEIEIANPDGSISRAAIQFQVVPESATQAPIVSGAQGGSFFQDTLFTVAGFNITGTTVILALGGIWAAKALKLIK